MPYTGPMTPLNASLTVLHIGVGSSPRAGQRLRLELRSASPEDAVARAASADLALVELPPAEALALGTQLRAHHPELALVALVPQLSDPEALALEEAGFDELLSGEVNAGALDLALRAAIDRRRAQVRAKRSAQRQRKTERALEEIVGAASHELRSPLSVIIGFGGLLVNDMRAELAPSALEPTRKILRSAERLEGLIRDLVTYARLDRELSPPSPVDAGLCADLAIEELSEAAAGVGAEILRGPMPNCLGNPSFVQHIFTELIRNSLRFHGSGTPKVELSGERQGHRCVYSVRDTGIGFEPRHSEDVFRLFRRLAPRTAETRGDGLGLALCRRMVDLMDGEIGAEAKPGAGARLWFSLPGGEESEGSLL